MSRIVYLLNGPNLNLLGKRQPHIYGHVSLADLEAECHRKAIELRLELQCMQSNAEHKLIEWIHEARERASGVVINPGAYSHTSAAILDALSMCDFPILEVHISNIYRREEFRKHSYVSMVATGVISGLGTQGYQLALQHIASLIDESAANAPSK